MDSDRICVRANTMYNLVDLNTKMAERIVPLFVPEGHSNVHPKAKVDPKANVSGIKIFFNNKTKTVQNVLGHSWVKLDATSSKFVKAVQTFFENETE